MYSYFAPWQASFKAQWHKAKCLIVMSGSGRRESKNERRLLVDSRLFSIPPTRPFTAPRLELVCRSFSFSFPSAPLQNYHSHRAVAAAAAVIVEEMK
jgi:hypothetical protein